MSPLYYLLFVFHLVLVTRVASRAPFPVEQRLSLAEPFTSYIVREPEGPETYAFGYDIDDPETQNTQFRDEERKSDGSVSGRYGWVAPDGFVYIVNYTADKNGYRANVEKAPSRLFRQI